MCKNRVGKKMYKQKPKDKFQKLKLNKPPSVPKTEALGTLAIFVLYTE